MIKSVLIANRGEIACRVIRTARHLGIRTVAVYSDADAHAPHAALADDSVRIGPPPAAESYLLGKRIIEAAKHTGAEAIHPGYGFLSENADFAEAVIKAGLIWVGPPPSAIRTMGLKDAAKSLMMAANVPTTPGYLGEDQSPNTLRAEAEKIGFPVLIKAVAGGGGKGMRRCEQASEFADALESCRREAKSAFGDDHVLLEKWITNPRHIEVQVFGDNHGNHVHLFERDCTLQRRHQKVIEEAPAPGMDEATRDAICTAAVRAAKAVDYVGAGTVEFIADGSAQLDADKIWFMEMNTRLQVEHPVTEMITGVDLVEWQLRVASGEPLPKKQDDLSITGWAMEARLYAENPSTGFLPSVGRLDVLALPDGGRVDTGVKAGGKVSPFYDPMISKLISHGVSRDEARSRLATACDNVVTYPVQNNAGFLARLLREQAFADADVTTGYIGDHLDRLCTRPTATEEGLGAAASLLFAQEQNDHHAEQRGAASVWSTLSGFRLSAPANNEAHIHLDGEPRDVTLLDHQPYSTRLFDQDGDVILVEKGWPFLVSLPVHTPEDELDSASGTITSPMPGSVTSIAVEQGASIKKGDLLITLEAMKMEHALKAPFDGVITELLASVGDQLPEGTKLLTMTPVTEA